MTVVAGVLYIPIRLGTDIIAGYGFLLLAALIVESGAGDREEYINKAGGLMRCPDCDGDLMIQVNNYGWRTGKQPHTVGVCVLCQQQMVWTEHYIFTHISKTTIDANLYEAVTEP